MKASDSRRHGTRTRGGTPHTAAYRLLGIAATLALILQMLAPLIGPLAPSAAYAQDASPAAVESPADGTQPVTPAQPEGPALDPAPVVDEPPPADTTAPVVTVPGTLYATAGADNRYGGLNSATNLGGRRC